jgi:hypothetical protein
MFPSKEEVEKVVEERKNAKGGFTSGYIESVGPGLYVDSKGLIHSGGPNGKVVSYVGWTKEQLDSVGENDFMPMPR